MGRRLATSSLFLLFGLAYATLDRLPRAASALRGGSEHVIRFDRAEWSTGPAD